MILVRSQKREMNRAKVILTFFLFYFAFICAIFFNRLPLSGGFKLAFVPDLAIILVFLFSNIKKSKIISYGNIFILGIIFDVLNLSVIGMTSICWMTGNKVISKLSNYFFNNEGFLAYLRDFVLFISISQFLKILFMYLMFAAVYSFFDIFVFIITNTIWFTIIFFLSNKLKIREVN